MRQIAWPLATLLLLSLSACPDPATTDNDAGSSTDACAADDRYNDGVCDTDCDEPDPDCEGGDGDGTGDGDGDGDGTGDGDGDGDGTGDGDGDGDGWLCDPAYYGAGDGCDCGCGIQDADCPDNNYSSCEYNNCPNGGSVNQSNPTQCNGTSSGAWTCDPSYQGGGDGCDCGCGVVDSDCPNSFASSCDYFFCKDEPVSANNNARCANDLPTTVPAPDSVVSVANAPVANVNADTNRDGQVNASDDSNEATWTATRGAIVPVNFDDDDNDGKRDAFDAKMNGASDVDDMAVLRIAQDANLADSYTAKIFVHPAQAAARVRIFDVVSAGATPFFDGATAGAELNKAAIRAGDVELRLEARAGRSVHWDGKLIVRLEYRNASNQLVSYDDVAVRAAPVVMPDNLQAPERLHVMRVTATQDAPNTAFWSSLQANLGDIELIDVRYNDHEGDRWVQDTMQTGYQPFPTTSGIRAIKTHVQLERPRGLFPYLPQTLLGPGLGYVYPGGSGVETSLNYGGNLEIFPPHTGPSGTEYPFGRIIVGGGGLGTIAGVNWSDRMEAPQLNYLEAQDVQGPAVEVSSEWLIVGHVDEVFQVIPNLNNPSRPYKVMIASPSLARTTLQTLQSGGMGGAAVFQGRQGKQTTVSAILNDQDLLAYNQGVQARIDTYVDTFMDAFGLTEDDFVEVPVLYIYEMYGQLDLAVAYNPGIQNLITAGDTLFIPDPEGPSNGSVDVWQQATLDAIAGTGLTGIFVDVFYSYHELYGEAHCGSSMERSGYETAYFGE